jgi:hypothetical protein
MSQKTTLVLGAGASLSMGYPTGEQLRRELITARPAKSRILQAMSSVSQAEIEEFVRTFRASQMNSIDAFLARRPEFSKVGKLAIAAILLSLENLNTLIDTPHEDNWYRYFFNKISSESWEDLNLSKYSVITFNYDRSFEQFMLIALCNSYNKSMEEAERKLKEMQIIHVYGSVGAIYPSDQDFYPYGEDVDFKKRVELAAQALKVIPEGRQDEPVLDAARALLKKADSIAFLGFGYDETNLFRLDVINTCTRKVEIAGRTKYRFIAGTCIGMNGAEQNRACKRIGKDIGTIKAINLFDLDCQNFLRQTAVLDR